MKNRSCAFIGVALSTFVAAAAQEPTPAPAFEVAAIYEHQPTPQILADIESGGLAPRMLVTEGRLRITFLSLREIVRRAYEVEHYQMDQMTAPEWTGQTRWNIDATMPAGVTRAQVPAMLRRLLAERFDLVVRLEPRPFPVYALVVGSGGARLRETEAGASAANPSAASDGGTPDAHPQTMESETSNALMKMSAGSGGTVRVDFIRMPISELAAILSEYVDRPVVDRTGLNGLYDFALEFSSDLPQVSGLGAGFGAPRGAAGSGPGSASTPPRQNAAIRSLETIGLALEARREPIQMLIVERVNRVPTPN